VGPEIEADRDADRALEAEAVAEAEPVMAEIVWTT